MRRAGPGTPPQRTPQPPHPRTARPWLRPPPPPPNPLGCQARRPHSQPASGEQCTPRSPFRVITPPHRFCWVFFFRSRGGSIIRPTVFDFVPPNRIFPHHSAYSVIFRRSFCALMDCERCVTHMHTHSSKQVIGEGFTPSEVAKKKVCFFWLAFKILFFPTADCPSLRESLRKKNMTQSCVRIFLEFQTRGHIERACPQSSGAPISRPLSPPSPPPSDNKAATAVRALHWSINTVKQRPDAFYHGVWNHPCAHFPSGSGVPGCSVCLSALSVKLFKRWTAERLPLPCCAPEASRRTGGQPAFAGPTHTPGFITLGTICRTASLVVKIQDPRDPPYRYISVPAAPWGPPPEGPLVAALVQDLAAAATLRGPFFFLRCVPSHRE